MKKVMILAPVWCGVEDRYCYYTHYELDYTAKNLYYAQQWVKRFNRYANEDLTVVVR